MIIHLMQAIIHMTWWNRTYSSNFSPKREALNLKVSIHFCYFIEEEKLKQGSKHTQHSNNTERSHYDHTTKCSVRPVLKHFDRLLYYCIAKEKTWRLKQIPSSLQPQRTLWTASVRYHLYKTTAQHSDTYLAFIFDIDF